MTPDLLCTLTAPWPLDVAAPSRTVVRVAAGRIADRRDIAFEHGTTIRALTRDTRPGRYLACSDAEVVVLNEDLQVLERHSDPRFNDLHDVTRFGGSLLVCNTGFDEILEIDARGVIRVVFDFTRLYGPSRVPRLDDNRLVCHETRLHAAHPNRARFCDPADERNLICSIFKTGNTSTEGAILCYRDGQLVWSVVGPELHGNHGPRPVPECEGMFVTCSSFRGRLLELSREGTGRLWGDLNFPKDVLPLDGGTFVVADSGNDRIVAVDDHGTVMWEVECENSPYSLETAW